MKINPIKTNFKGISNPLSTNLKAEDGEVCILSAKIDNIDKKDFDYFKEIKQRLNYHNDEVQTDVITITTIDMKDKDNKHIFVNGKPILLGSDLKSLGEKLTSEAEKKAYKAEETAHLKLYTFIADITKRMMNMDPPQPTEKAELINSWIIDTDKNHVVQEMYAHLYEIVTPSTKAQEIVQKAILDNEPFQPNAYKINEFVQKTMNIFFEELHKKI